MDEAEAAQKRAKAQAAAEAAAAAAEAAGSKVCPGSAESECREWVCSGVGPSPNRSQYGGCVCGGGLWGWVHGVSCLHCQVVGHTNTERDGCGVWVFESCLWQTSSGRKKLKVPEQYRTLRAALKASNKGDVIEVSPGSYNEAVVIDKVPHALGHRQP